VRWPKLKWWHYLLGAAGVGLLLWEGDELVSTAIDLTQRGRRLSYGPELGANGQVNADPESLRLEAAATLGRDVSMEAYALARMLRSEGGGGSVAELQARAWVALNDAAAHGWSILHTIAGPDGLFGQQRGWRYASGKDPYERELGVAELVWSEQLPDNTGGATKFVDIDSFGVQPGTGTYAELVAKWAKERLEPFTVEGTGENFRVFRRVG
jgi:hypothetical protein